MAGLYWMAVTLALMLSAGNTLPAVDQNKLLQIVNQILNRFAPKDQNDDRFAPSYGNKDLTPPMFSLAVSIPYNSVKKIYDTSKVTDDGDQVRREILSCEVYTSKRMVAATVLRWPNVLHQCPKGHMQWPDVLNECPKKVRWKVNTWEKVDELCPEVVDRGRADHAEYRILQNFKTLLNRNDKKQNLLLFYVRSSPCPRRCTNESNPDNILKSINKIKEWGDYAVVFSDVFKPRDGVIPEDDLCKALKQLGTFQGDLGPIGLDHIFRCDKQQCRSCSDNDEVAWYCFSDNKSSGRSCKPQQGRSGQGARGKQSKNIGGQGGSGPDVGKGSRQKKGKQGKNIGGQGGSGPDVGKGSRQKKGKQGKNIGGQGGSGPDVGKGSRQKKGKQGKNIGGQGGSGPDVGKGSRQKKGKQGKNIGGQGGSGPDVGKGSRQKKGKSKG